ncbi:MAG: FlgD immunoglobulin-like domain containing protein, partial [bacterium]
DYIKDTDAARVTATVTDDDPAFDASNITADLTGLGGGPAVNPDTYVAGVATWTTMLTNVACTPANGTVTVTVTATDDLGNTASDSDDITSDNIAPAAIGDLAAAQVKSGNTGNGTTDITLTFTAPGDAYETEVYHAGYGDYPEYDDGTGTEPAAPSYPPASPWAVTGVTATGQTDEPAARDFWYYVVFTKDIAYNVSAVSNKTTGTLNYHLGDVSDGSSPGTGDTYVNSVDFSLMGSSYWKNHGEAGYLNYCDVGPTTDLSTDKLPTTDNVIDFEDLMMFAINFTTVSFTGGDYPEAMAGIERPALRLEWDEQGEDRTDVIVARLLLEGNSRAVKGLHAEVLYEPSGLELVGVTPGELLAGQGSPVFSENQDVAGRVHFDAAILGRNITIMGSGEVAAISFRLVGGVSHLPVLKVQTLRDRKNRPMGRRIEPEVVDESVPAPSTPGVLSLGSHPNPFSGSTQIRLNLPSEVRVSLSIYDVTGRLVRTLADGVMTAGEHNVEWNGRSASGGQVAAGVYVVRMDVEGRRVTRKLFVLP